MSKSKSLIRGLPEGFEWAVEWEQDPDMDDSELGEWSRNSYYLSYRVDTENGWLLGPDEESSYEQRVWVGEYPEQIIDSDGRIFDLQDEDTGEYYCDGVRILRRFLSEYHGDSRYWRKYWYPSDMRFSKDLKKEIAEYGLEKVLDWVQAGYELHISWCNNDWHYQWCCVKLMYDPTGDGYAPEMEEVTFDSMGGIADPDGSYAPEVEEDLMWGALNLEQIEEFIKGHALVDILDEQVLYAEFVELHQRVEAQRKAAYEAQRAEWEAKKNG